MKIRTVLFIGFLALVTNDSMCQNWNKISKEIRKVQLRVSPSQYVHWHYNLRKSSDCFNHLNIEKNDTLFLLENENDYSSPMITLTLWNKSDTLTFDSNNCYYNTPNGGKNVIESNEIGFTKYMMKLVSEWNVEEIKKEDKLNGASLPQYWVIATRIIINGKKYKIDLIRFKDFFNIQRDGMDFSN